jgi:hypothetical protein
VTEVNDVSHGQRPLVSLGATRGLQHVHALRSADSEAAAEMFIAVSGE